MDFVDIPDWTAIPEALDNFMIALSIQLAARVEWLSFDPSTNTLTVSIPVGTLTADAERLTRDMQTSLTTLTDSSLLSSCGIQAVEVEQTEGAKLGPESDQHE